ncbi:MAG: macro domain-containing protein [candidate division KSB1 bacterium]|nr:macro domain-containing protein [candidate division KSB1 bacterium]MDZ7275547.1 macro domain-containing protein [candidate division KSB1 bacterium]MDZ7286141.1 macro domain-containing protein [candidate division KSB1 bacterium]MDZ7296367.1 macro domain-containing protein [candidate division KSB1 bacterium]MDZ7307143.1 macro domain-containing protein [candidate division KSB1 bacterium]
MEIRIKHTTVQLREGDLTEMKVDAIVNAANSALQLGGGVAGAIRRKGGPCIQQECDRLGGTPVGTAVITSGGNLPARYVIHAVGPRMGEGEEDRKLREATRHALTLADQHHLKSIAFPAISTGIFGYPLERCAQIMLATTLAYVGGETGLQQVVFCLWGEQAYRVFETTLRQLQYSASSDQLNDSPSSSAT